MACNKCHKNEYFLFLPTFFFVKTGQSICILDISKTSLKFGCAVNLSSFFEMMQSGGPQAGRPLGGVNI